MRRFMCLCVLVGCLGLTGLARAVQFIANPRVEEGIAVTVKDIEPSEYVRVPLITWGGDIGTIHANGDTARTVAGSIFAQQGLKLDLAREDNFQRQVENYLAGRTPYLRGTLGMITMALDAVAGDPRTKPVIIYQHTWSNGGDCLVVKGTIDTAKDLKGKTVALQAFGPHVYYLSKILNDAGLSAGDVHLKWVKDLTGSPETPLEAFYDSSVDAAMVIIPDGLVLTSNGTGGTGAEGSVKGAKILLTTKTANRVIADVYAVRSDYYQTHRPEVEKFVHGLLLGGEAVEKLFKDKKGKVKEYSRMLGGAAERLLDSKAATGDVEALFADCEYVGFSGNIKFFTDTNYPRNLRNVAGQIQQAMGELGLLRNKAELTVATHNFEALKAGLTNTSGVVIPKFDTEKVSAVVQRKQQQGSLAEGELFSFEVFFQPNQNQFAAEMYTEAFNRVIELASTYGGALITIEGHSDPLAYLKAKKKNSSELVLRQMLQSAKNLSLSRANSVRSSIMAHATSRGISMDESQLAVVGHGIMKPRNGMCGEDPCPPKSEQEWRDNMRVEFRIIQVEAESAVFNPL